MIFKNKKGLGKAITLLLSIALIAVELIIFYQAGYNLLKPARIGLQEVPNQIDNSAFLINLLQTQTKDGRVYDLLQFCYFTDSCESFKSQVSDIIKKYYGENYIWKINMKDKSVDNYSLIQGISKEQVYETELMAPLYSKEAVKIVLYVFKK